MTHDVPAFSFASAIRDQFRTTALTSPEPCIEAVHRNSGKSGALEEAAQINGTELPQIGKTVARFRVLHQRERKRTPVVGVDVRFVQERHESTRADDTKDLRERAGHVGDVMKEGVPHDHVEDVALVRKGEEVRRTRRRAPSIAIRAPLQLLQLFLTEVRGRDARAVLPCQQLAEMSTTGADVQDASATCRLEIGGAEAYVQRLPKDSIERCIVRVAVLENTVRGAVGVVVDVDTKRALVQKVGASAKMVMEHYADGNPSTVVDNCFATSAEHNR
jgi:hypothetical protein